MDRTVSIKQKIENIRKLLIKCKQFNFNQIISGAESKTEVIISFLALLELVKDQTVCIKQNKAFEELIVEKV